MSKLYVKSHSRFRVIPVACAVNLPFRLDPQVRLAQISDCMPQLGGLTAFRPDSPTHLQGYCPNILVGTARDVQDLAGQVDLGTLDLSCVDHAVIIITRCGEAPLTDVARVVFWQTFGVPVFEIYTGLDNSILGYECDLHEGWHLAPGVDFSREDGELLLNAPGVSGLRTALAGAIIYDKCPCGREGPRLMEIAAAQRMQGHECWRATA